MLTAVRKPDLREESGCAPALPAEALGPGLLLEAGVPRPSPTSCRAVGQTLTGTGKAPQHSHASDRLSVAFSNKGKGSLGSLVTACSKYIVSG